jgi:glucose-1-phosphate cytidylyltransferase
VTQTVIFCGGKGTRISGNGPEKKELFEIGNRPILWHIMKLFATYGHRDFVLPLGHRGDLIRRYFLEYEQMNRDLCFRLGSPETAACAGANDESDWRITLVDTGLQDETGREISKGERVRRVAHYLTGERFFLTYGDGIGDVDLDALCHFHREHGRWVTVTGYQPVYQYGTIEADDDGRVGAYHQYPRMSHWINAGFFLVERDALDALEPGLDWESGFMVRLAEMGQIVMYKHAGFWRKMDTFKEAQQLNDLWQSGRAPWKRW